MASHGLARPRQETFLARGAAVVYCFSGPVTGPGTNSAVRAGALRANRSSNLSRTLKTLARYGIVELSKEDRSVKPVVKATEFQVTFGLNLPHCPAT